MGVLLRVLQCEARWEASPALSQVCHQDASVGDNLVTEYIRFVFSSRFPPYLVIRFYSFLLMSLTCVSFFFSIAAVLLQARTSVPCSLQFSATLPVSVISLPLQATPQSYHSEFFLGLNSKPTPLVNSFNFCCFELCILGELRPLNFMDE